MDTTDNRLGELKESRESEGNLVESKTDLERIGGTASLKNVSLISWKESQLTSSECFILTLERQVFGLESN